MATPTIEVTLPPVPSAQFFTDKTGTLTQPAQQWLINLRDKVNAINAVVIAISGAGTPIGAFNELSPLTTNGDLLTYSGGTNVRLPIGTNGQVLTVVSGMPSWAAGGGGGSPLTTKGDLYGFNTTNARIPVGTDGQVLTARSSNALGVDWEASSTGTYAIPPFASVLTLLHFNGTSGSSTFTDQVAGITWTAGAGATLSNTQVLFGTTSGKFANSTTSYIYLTSPASFNLGSSPFTVEFSIYLVSGGVAGSIFRLNVNTTTNNSALLINCSATGAITIYASSTGSSWDLISAWAPTTIPVNQWSRVLIQRVANSLQFYINGSFIADTLLVGSLYYNAASTTSWGGISNGAASSALIYLDECRITSGLALITSYTPLTSEFPNS